MIGRIDEEIYIFSYGPRAARLRGHPNDTESARGASAILSWAQLAWAVGHLAAVHFHNWDCHWLGHWFLSEYFYPEKV